MTGLSDGWGNVSPSWPAIVRFPGLSGVSFLRTGQGARISTSACFTFIAIATNHWIKEFARQQGASANIPPKRNRKDRICFSPYLYRGWNLIERFFNKIKQCRRVGPGTTNSQPTIWRLSRSRQFEFGYALMSPRPNASSALRLLTAALSSEYVSTIIPAYRITLL
jgi:hypothetical protein